MTRTEALRKVAGAVRRKMRSIARCARTNHGDWTKDPGERCRRCSWDGWDAFAEAAPVLQNFDLERRSKRGR